MRPRAGTRAPLLAAALLILVPDLARAAPGFTASCPDALRKQQVDDLAAALRAVDGPCRLARIDTDTFRSVLDWQQGDRTHTVLLAPRDCVVDPTHRGRDLAAVLPASLDACPAARDALTTFLGDDHTLAPLLADGPGHEDPLLADPRRVATVVALAALLLALVLLPRRLRALTTADRPWLLLALALLIIALLARGSVTAAPANWYGAFLPADGWGDLRFGAGAAVLQSPIRALLPWTADIAFNYFRLLGALCVPLVVLLVRRLGGTLPAAALAGLLLALEPIPVRLAASSSEHLLAATLALAAWVTWQRTAVDPTHLPRLLALLLAALAVLTRVDCLPQLALIPLWTTLAPNFNNSRFAAPISPETSPAGPAPSATASSTSSPSTDSSTISPSTDSSTISPSTDSSVAISPTISTDSSSISPSTDSSTISPATDSSSISPSTDSSAAISPTISPSTDSSATSTRTNAPSTAPATSPPTHDSAAASAALTASPRLPLRRRLRDAAVWYAALACIGAYAWLDIIRPSHHPGPELHGVLQTARRLLTQFWTVAVTPPHWLGLPALALVVLGLVAAARRRRWTWLCAALASLALLFIPLGRNLTHDGLTGARYFVLLSPLLALLAAHAVIHLAWPARRIALLLAAFTALELLAARPGWRHETTFQAEHRHLRRALADHAQCTLWYVRPRQPTSEPDLDCCLAPDRSPLALQYPHLRFRAVPDGAITLAPGCNLAYEGSICSLDPALAPQAPRAAAGILDQCERLRRLPGRVLLRATVPLDAPHPRSPAPPQISLRLLD